MRVAGILGILAVVFFAASIGLFVSAYLQKLKEPQLNETSIQSNISIGTNIRSNPQREQTVSDVYYGIGGFLCACGVFCAIGGYLRFRFRDLGSEDPSTDDNPSDQLRTDAIVRGAIERLSGEVRQDSEGLPNEPPDASSSNEAAVLFREILQKEGTSNDESGVIRLRERRVSAKDLTDDDAPSLAEMCSSSLRSSCPRQQSLEAEDPTSAEMCASSLRSSSVKSVERA